MVSELPIVRAGPDQGRLSGANIAPGQNDVTNSDSFYFYGKIKDMRRLGAEMKIPSPTIQQSEALYRRVANRRYVRSAFSNHLSMFVATRNEPHNQLMLFDFWEHLAVERIALSKPFFRMTKSDINYRDHNEESDRILTIPPRNDIETMLGRFYDELFPNTAQNDEYERLTIIRDAVLFFQRMEYNSLLTGRNPRSLYGACLLLASTLNGKYVSKTQVANAVRMSESILQKRLRELNGTWGTDSTINEYMEAPISEWQSNPVPPCMTQQKRCYNTDSPARGDSNDSFSELSYSLPTIYGQHDSGDEISLPSDDERDVESYLLEPEEVEYRTKVWEKEFGSCSYTPRRKRSRIPFTPENYNTITRYFPSCSQPSSQEEAASVTRSPPAAVRRKRQKKAAQTPANNKKITDFFSPVTELSSQDSYSLTDSPATPVTRLFEETETDRIAIHPFLTPENSQTEIPPTHPYMTPPYSEYGDELDFSLSDHDADFLDLHNSEL